MDDEEGLRFAYTAAEVRNDISQPCQAFDVGLATRNARDHDAEAEMDGSGEPSGLKQDDNERLRDELRRYRDCPIEEASDAGVWVALRTDRPPDSDD